MIRWKFVVPALLIMVAIAAFNIFFLDSILKRALIVGGQAAFGAKVEIDGFKTRFKDLSVHIIGLRVADKNDVWRNLADIGDVRFGVEPWPLLSKKIVIDEMALEGVHWGTKRTSSGALPKRKASKIAGNQHKEDKNSLTARLMAKIEQKGKEEVTALPGVESIRNAQANMKDISVEKVVSMSSLQSVKMMDDARKEMEQKYGEYEKRLADLKIDEKAKNALAAANDAASINIKGVQDIEPAKKKIENLNRSRGELEKSLADVQSLRNDMGKYFDNEKGLVERINQQKDKDYQNAAAKLSVPSLSFGNVSQYVFGPAWLARVNSIVSYMHLARKYMPKKSKKDDVVVRPRARGRDISFAREGVPPGLWIKKMTLSGTTGGPGKEGDALDFKGNINDITSDPVLLGRPVTLAINGAKAGRQLQVNGLFDHAADIPVDRLKIVFNGLTAQDLKIPESDYLPSFEKGTGNVTADFALKGDTLDSSVALGISGISFTGRGAANEEVRSVLASLWNGVDNITVNARLAGDANDLKMTLSSNIDSLLSDRLRSMYGAKMAELQNRIRAEIDRVTAGKQKELLAEYGSRRDALMKEYTAKENEARARIDASNAQTAQKEKEMRGSSDNERRKAEEELKKKAQDQLRNLFK